MVAASVAAWALAAGLIDAEQRAAALYGMLGPLVVTVGSWMVMERVHRRRPAALTSVMIAGFGIKVVGVGAYVAVMLGLLSIDRTAFVVSFTAFFIALYAVEALLLRRLLAGAPGAVGSSSQD
jgi:hypothetical protein